VEESEKERLIEEWSNRSLNDILLRLKILGLIVDEATRAGDERWHVAAEQADILNEARGRLLKRAGAVPEAQTISVQMGVMGARGLTAHG
jgi:hypothetical protein